MGDVLEDQGRIRFKTLKNFTSSFLFPWSPKVTENKVIMENVIENLFLYKKNKKQTKKNMKSSEKGQEFWNFIPTTCKIVICVKILTVMVVPDFLFKTVTIIYP